MLVGHVGKYHNTICLFPQILHKHCFQFLLRFTMLPRESSLVKTSEVDKKFLAERQDTARSQIFLQTSVVVY